MAKGQKRSKKILKKKPLKTLKEKRQDKREKKSQGSDQIIIQPVKNANK